MNKGEASPASRVDGSRVAFIHPVSVKTLALSQGNTPIDLGRRNTRIQDRLVSSLQSYLRGSRVQTGVDDNTISMKICIRLAGASVTLGQGHDGLQQVQQLLAEPSSTKIRIEFSPTTSTTLRVPNIHARTLNFFTANSRMRVGCFCLAKADRKRAKTQCICANKLPLRH